VSGSLVHVCFESPLPSSDYVNTQFHSHTATWKVLNETHHSQDRLKVASFQKCICLSVLILSVILLCFIHLFFYFSFFIIILIVINSLPIHLLLIFMNVYVESQLIISFNISNIGHFICGHLRVNEPFLVFCLGFILVCNSYAYIRNWFDGRTGKVAHVPIALKWCNSPLCNLAILLFFVKGESVPAIKTDVIFQF